MLMQYTTQGACYPGSPFQSDEAENFYNVSFIISKEGVINSLPFIQEWFDTDYRLVLNRIFDDAYTVEVNAYLTDSEKEECQMYLYEKAEAEHFKFEY